jgi:hypothetical protein
VLYNIDLEEPPTITADSLKKRNLVDIVGSGFLRLKTLLQPKDEVYVKSVMTGRMEGRLSQSASNSPAPRRRLSGDRRLTEDAQLSVDRRLPEDGRLLENRRQPEDRQSMEDKNLDEDTKLMQDNCTQEEVSRYESTVCYLSIRKLKRLTITFWAITVNTCSPRN